MNDIVNIISTLGFPIFCVIALGALVFKGFEKITGTNEAREQKLYEMLGETREQLRKATEINASFVEILSDFRTDLSTIQDDIQSIKLKMKEGET